MVEVSATTNKHIAMERIFMMHLQWCISTKRTSIPGLVVRADFLKIVSNGSFGPAIYFGDDLSAVKATQLFCDKSAKSNWPNHLN